LCKLEEKKKKKDRVTHSPLQSNHPSSKTTLRITRGIAI
jgi:hypothetical protein